MNELIERAIESYLDFESKHFVLWGNLADILEDTAKKFKTKWSKADLKEVLDRLGVVKPNDRHYYYDRIL